MCKRKFADANDLGVDHPQQVGPHAYLVSMKSYFNAACSPVALLLRAPPPQSKRKSPCAQVISL